MIGHSKEMFLNVSSISDLFIHLFVNAYYTLVFNWVLRIIFKNGGVCYLQASWKGKIYTWEKATNTWQKCDKYNVNRAEKKGNENSGRVQSLRTA